MRASLPRPPGGRPLRSPIATPAAPVTSARAAPALSTTASPQPSAPRVRAEARRRGSGPADPLRAAERARGNPAARRRSSRSRARRRRLGAAAVGRARHRRSSVFGGTKRSADSRPVLARTDRGGAPGGRRILARPSALGPANGGRALLRLGRNERRALISKRKGVRPPMFPGKGAFMNAQCAPRSRLGRSRSLSGCSDPDSDPEEPGDVAAEVRSRIDDAVAEGFSGSILVSSGANGSRRRPTVSPIARATRRTPWKRRSTWVRS